jgi:hypothetical protein
LIFGNETLTGRNDPNHLTGGDPFDLVTGPDLELIRDCLGYRNLVFRCDLRHILTVARIESLLKAFQRPSSALESSPDGAAPLM